MQQIRSRSRVDRSPLLCKSNAMVHPLRPRLTVGDLQELVRDMRATLSQEPHVLRYGLGNLIAIELLGSRHGFLPISQTLDNSPFFAFVPESLVSQYRGELFGEALFNLQGVSGFDEWLADFSIDAHESRFSEVQAAARMHRAGLLRNLRRRTGQKGHDYDCDISIAGTDIACEIKANVEATALSTRAFLNAVGRARRQLPADKGGIVWVKLPLSWSERIDSMNLTVAVAMQTVQEHARNLRAVVVQWEEIDGPIIRLKSAVFWAAPDEDGLIKVFEDALANSRSPNWIAVADLVFGSTNV